MSAPELSVLVVLILPLVQCGSHAAHMLLTCCSHATHMLLTCCSHAAHMLLTCCSHAAHMLLTCCSHIIHMLIHIQPFTCAGGGVYCTINLQNIPPITQRVCLQHRTTLHRFSEVIKLSSFSCIQQNPLIQACWNWSSQSGHDQNKFEDFNFNNIFKSQYS